MLFLQVTNSSTFQQINDNKLNSINFKKNDVELVPAPLPQPRQRAATTTKKADRLEIVANADAKKTIAKKAKATVAAKPKAAVAPKSKSIVAAKPKKAKVAASNKKTVKAVAVPEAIDDVALTDDMEGVESDSDSNVSTVIDQEAVMEPNSTEELGDAQEDSLDGVSSPAAIVPGDRELDRSNETLQASSRNQSGGMQSAQINMIDSTCEISVSSEDRNSFNKLDTIAEVTSEDVADSTLETITEAIEDSTAEAVPEANASANTNATVSSVSRISSVSTNDIFSLSTYSENISTMETSYDDQSNVSNVTDDSANTSMLPPAIPPFRPPNIFIKQTAAALKTESQISDDSIIFVPNDPPEVINISDVSDVNSTLNDSNNGYSFSMLQTDDSTDDEDYKNEKSTKKRSDPPVWSLSENRIEFIEKQAIIPMNVIDTFFMTHCDVDLTEIFPNINPAKTKRRKSSAHWNTPPRYSLMPKH